MLVIDRVYCNYCHADMGQFFGLRSNNHELPDLMSAPYMCVCNDCADSRLYAGFDIFDIEPIGHLSHFPSCEVTTC